MPMPQINIAGQTFGRLLVLQPTGIAGGWQCRCECGREIVAFGKFLRCGSVQSCGCLRKELLRQRSLTHGGTGTPEYSSYQAARERCTYPKADNYPRYGGRGIKFLFTSFEQFFSELGPRPEGKTLDRIDTNGHYEPGNVKWSTVSEQNRNQRRNAKKVPNAPA